MDYNNNVINWKWSACFLFYLITSWMNNIIYYSLLVFDCV